MSKDNLRTILITFAVVLLFSSLSFSVSAATMTLNGSNVIADTTVNASAADSNFGTDSVMNAVGRLYSQNDKQNPYLIINISSIPRNAYTYDSKLFLYISSEGIDFAGESPYFRPRYVYNSWNETNLTWNTRPLSNDMYMGVVKNVPFDIGSGWFNFTVTNITKQSVFDSTGLVEIGLLDEVQGQGTVADDPLYFATKEAGLGTAANLSINYTSIALAENVTCAGGSCTDTLSGNIALACGGLTTDVSSAEYKVYLGKSTATSASTYSYTETFETDTGNWTQGTGDNGDWTRDSSGTPSGGTGCTNGATSSTWYMYTEASSKTVNSYTDMLSPLFNASDNVTFTFDYNMYNAYLDNNMGYIYVDVLNGTDNVTYVVDYGSKSYPSQSVYTRQSVTIRGYEGQEIQIRIRGQYGNGGNSFAGDRCIDNLNITVNTNNYTNYTYIGNHSIGSSYSWDSSGSVGESYDSIKCVAITNTLDGDIERTYEEPIQLNITSAPSGYDNILLNATFPNVTEFIKTDFSTYNRTILNSSYGVYNYTAQGWQFSDSEDFEYKLYVNQSGSSSTSNFTVNNLTISFWAYPTTSGSNNNQYVVCHYDWRFYLTNSSGKDIWTFSTGRYTNSTGPAYTSIGTSTDVSRNAWQHVVGVYRPNAAGGGYTKIYVNGDLKDTDDIGSLFIWTGYNGNKNLQVGNSNHGAAVPFGGLVDDLLIYDKALNDTEVLSLYNAGRQYNVSDTCTYTGSGDWLITDNCTISDTVDMGGNNVIIDGVKIHITGRIYNWSKFLWQNYGGYYIINGGRIG